MQRLASMRADVLATAVVAAAIVVLLHLRKRQELQKTTSNTSSAPAQTEPTTAQSTRTQPTQAEPTSVLVATLQSSRVSDAFACLDVSSDTIPQWPAEPIVVWYRRMPGDDDNCEVFAMQEACPHASISLVESDIEDFRAENEGKLKGPCISCPAHSYIFDAGTGKCITNQATPDARTYPAWAEPTPSGEVRIFVRPERHPPNAPGPSPLTQQEANSIQLEMVDRALRRRFGDDDEGEDDDVFGDGAVQSAGTTGP